MTTIQRGDPVWRDYSVEEMRIEFFRESVLQWVQNCLPTNLNETVPPEFFFINEQIKRDKNCYQGNLWKGSQPKKAKMHPSKWRFQLQHECFRKTHLLTSWTIVPVSWFPWRTFAEYEHSLGRRWKLKFVPRSWCVTCNVHITCILHVCRRITAVYGAVRALARFNICS